MQHALPTSPPPLSTKVGCDQTPPETGGSDPLNSLNLGVPWRLLGRVRRVHGTTACAATRSRRAPRSICAGISGLNKGGFFGELAHRAGFEPTTPRFVD